MSGGAVAKGIAKGGGEATAGALKGMKNVDELAKGLVAVTKRLDDLDVDSLKQLRKLDDVGDASFLAKNAKTLLAGGVAVGGLYYLDQQYANAKEEVKDCMKVCLP